MFGLAISAKFRCIGPIRKGKFMFLKSLTISTPTKVIREILFHKGLNLIIDDSNDQVTGNNVGKTTVLRLIDYCLGGKAKEIYIDPENKKSEYTLVKEFLIKNKVIITLILSNNLDVLNDDVIIRRNFITTPRKEAIREINGKSISKDDFVKELSMILFPSLDVDKKPTFRQVISHNIRYSHTRVSNTLRTLDSYTSDAEYESLYLYMFGCRLNAEGDRQPILEKLKTEQAYKRRLEQNQSRNKYEIMLRWIDDQISCLNKKKSDLNINENFEYDIESLNKIKYRINQISSEISSLNLRKNIILDAKHDFESQKSDIDTDVLASLYKQASSFIPALQHSFEDLLAYHNQMIVQKIKFITNELPSLEERIEAKNNELTQLLEDESIISGRITKSDTFEELEDIIAELNELFKKKGEYENIISQILDVESNITRLNSELCSIDMKLFSQEFEKTVKTQLSKFNTIFRKISEAVYQEPYAIAYDIITNQFGQKVYKFSSFNANHSSGKKQGEISCFDIAYTLFADSENIPCLHFLLNDKKELVHDNQLIRIAEIVNSTQIQFIASILKVKLPNELDKEEFFILELSQNNKLFKIEE